MKDVLLELTQDVEIVVDGETTVAEVTVGQVVRAAPNKILADGQYVANPEAVGRYIRLHLRFQGSWRWNAPIEDWNEGVAADPAADPRWAQE